MPTHLTIDSLAAWAADFKERAITDGLTMAPDILKGVLEDTFRNDKGELLKVSELVYNELFLYFCKGESLFTGKLN